MFENLLGGGKKQGGPATANKPVIQPAAPMPTPPTAMAPAAPSGGATSAGKDISVEVEDLRKDVDKLKDSVNALRGTLKSLTEKMDSIENNLAQLASVYELLTNQMNPFLDEDERRVTQPKPKKETPAPTAHPAVPAPVPETKEEDVVLPELDLTNPKVIQTLLDWMQFVVERVGHAGVKDVLQYYVDVRWISSDVAEVLQRYADGIKVEVEPEVEQPVQLDPEDHMKSLDYILQIKEFQGKG